MRRLAALFALFAVIAIALTADPRHPADASAASLDWKNCNGGFQCATLQVPLDYSNPGGAKTSLALIKRPANDQSKKIGSLLTNPGGPGGSGIDFVRSWAGALGDDILNRFDIVGFDPRGVGESSPLECHQTLIPYTSADPSPDTQAEFDQLAAVNEKFADDCAAAAGDAINFYGTKNVARDMDQIRQAVGDPKLTYVGYSYGTVIGQVYAELFPQNIRAMVLDGAVDLALSADDLTISQAAGFERALNNFLDNCRSEGSGCRLNKYGDPATAITQLMAKAEEAPIPAKSVDRPAGPGEVLLGLITPLYNQASWPVLEVIVDQALSGDGSGIVRTADAYLDRHGNDYGNSMEMNLAVNCIDNEPSKLPTTFADYEKELPAIKAEAPRFGPALATGLTCEFWAAKPDPLSPPTDVTGTPPIVVISTTGDPATPYEWGVDVSRQLSSAVLITHRGEGHTVYGGEDPCVDDAVNAYLLDLKPPQDGLQCGDGPLPPDENATPTPAASATPPTSATPSASGPPASPTPRPTNTPGPARTPRPVVTPSDPGNIPSDDPVNGWVVFGTGFLVMFGLAALGTIWMSRRP